MARAGGAAERGSEPGAGEGNRTLVVSLEGFCSTIELHPRATPTELFSRRIKGLSRTAHARRGLGRSSVLEFVERPCPGITSAPAAFRCSLREPPKRTREYKQFPKAGQTAPVSADRGSLTRPREDRGHWGVRGHFNAPEGPAPAPPETGKPTSTGGARGGQSSPLVVHPPAFLAPATAFERKAVLENQPQLAVVEGVGFEPT